MTRDLRNKRILITGASSGIGKALAQEAVAQGARVILTARSADKLEELARSLTAQGGEAVAVPGDVTAEADRVHMIQAAQERFGGLDVLINNAGVGSQGHFADSTETIMRQVMELNFFAPAELIRLAIPLLTRGEQPAILNVASMCGRRAMPAWPEYSASKYALCGLTECLRGEMVRFGIDVLLVVPGLTSTNLDQNLLRHDGRMVINFKLGVAPEVMARKILRALRKNKTETVLGMEAWWVVLINRLMPWVIDLVMSQYVRRLYAREAKLQH